MPTIKDTPPGLPGWVQDQVKGTGDPLALFRGQKPRQRQVSQPPPPPPPPEPGTAAYAAVGGTVALPPPTVSGNVEAMLVGAQGLLRQSTTLQMKRHGDVMKTEVNKINEENRKALDKFKSYLKHKKKHGFLSKLLKGLAIFGGVLAIGVGAALAWTGAGMLAVAGGIALMASGAIGLGMQVAMSFPKVQQYIQKHPAFQWAMTGLQIGLGLLGGGLGLIGSLAGGTAAAAEGTADALEAADAIAAPAAETAVEATTEGQVVAEEIAEEAAEEGQQVASSSADESLGNEVDTTNEFAEGQEGAEGTGTVDQEPTRMETWASRVAVWGTRAEAAEQMTSGGVEIDDADQTYQASTAKTDQEQDEDVIGQIQKMHDMEQDLVTELMHSFQKSMQSLSGALSQEMNLRDVRFTQTPA
jgi:hypothetical protein